MTKEQMEELKRWIDERIKGSEDYILKNIRGLKPIWEFEERISKLEKKEEKNA